MQGVVRGWLASKGADIASATTTDLGAVEGLMHDITGTTTITGFGTISAGIWKVLKYEGVLTITHNATSLILLTGQSRTTQVGDIQIVASEGSGNWREWAYLPIGGLGSLPQNSQSAAYTTVAADANKHILHPTADNNARTFTIDSNANVPYPVGTTITFVNQINTVTIAITSDTLTLAGAGTTGSRTLAANGIATALKIASTSWLISGTGLT